MPFKSKAQQREMFANQPEIAKRWAAETPNMKSLPARVSPTKGKTNPRGSIHANQVRRDKAKHK